MMPPVVAGALAGATIIGLALLERPVRARRRVARITGRNGHPAGRPTIPVWPAPALVVRQWRSAGVKADADRWFTAWVAATVLVPLAVAGLGGGPLALAAAAALATGPIVGAWALRDRRVAVVEGQLPGFLDAAARGLRAGLSLSGAFVDAAARAPFPLSADLTVAVDALAAGEAFPEALHRWSRSCGREPSRGLVLACAAFALAADTGGARAQAVDGVAATLRERQGVQREAHALATQARLSALVIVIAPVAFAVFAAAVDQAVVTFLVRSPLGWACVGGGLALDAAGAWWMARMSRRLAR